MTMFSKKVIKWLLIAITIFLIGYGSYKIYNFVVKDITQRVKKGVSSGVSEGIGKSLNPLKLPGKIFGGKG